MRKHDAHTASDAAVSDATRRLSLLSANIQAGHATNSYRDYVTGSWNHVLPSGRKRGNLDALAQRVSSFDIV